MNHTVLIANQDVSTRRQIQSDLNAFGYQVFESDDGYSTMTASERHAPDVVILENYFSDMNGLELCRKLKSTQRSRIMFLSASDSEIDQLLAFASGADDYLVSPVSSRILAARVEALANRALNLAGQNRKIAVSDLEIDLDSRTTRYRDVSLTLTRIEFDLLTTLMQNPKRVVPRSELIDNVWGDWGVDVHVVESHLSRLRNKIRRAGGPTIGIAVRSVGYKLGLDDLMYTSSDGKGTLLNFSAQ